MDKVKEKLLDKFKRANKTRRVKIANDFGFNTPEEYETYLKGKEFVNIIKEPVKIHIVNMLDNSGSMSGDKFNNAYAAIKKEVIELKAAKDAKYTYSLFHFTGNNVPLEAVSNQPIYEVQLPSLGPDTGTPLYDTIVFMSKKLLEQIKYNTDRKVLVKIFTDGKDLHSRTEATDARKAIEDMQSNGITVTFVGTKYDVEDIILSLRIDASNTLVHDNTGKGVKEAFDITRSATQSYTKNVIEGKDVSKGFYKNIK